MRSLLAACGTVLCALVITACATDSPTTSGDTADVTAMPADQANVIDVPPELAFTQPDGTFDGNTFTAHPDACHVTLLFCRDSRFKPPIPSFCQNGGCSDSQALSAALSLCHSICGNVSCNPIAQFPNRSGC